MELRTPSEDCAPQIAEFAATAEIASLFPSDLEGVDLARAERTIRRRYAPRVVAACGGLVAYEGQVVAAVLTGDAFHPLTGLHERHLLDLVHHPDHPDSLNRLLPELEREARTEGVDLLRAEVSVRSKAYESLQSAGFRESHLVMRKRVVDRAEPGDRYRMTGDGERAFARSCLKQGIINGLHHAGVPVEEDKVDAYCKQRFHRLQGKKRLSIVAHDEGALRAHAYVELERSELTGRLEGRLVDAFTLPEWKGEGWAIGLWRRVETVLAELGIERCNGTLARADPDDVKVLANLERDGWWVEAASLVKNTTPRMESR